MTQWQDCTFEEALETGLDVCQWKSNTWFDYRDLAKGTYMPVLLWRRPVTSAAPDPGEGYRLLTKDEPLDNTEDVKPKNAPDEEWRPIVPPIWNGPGLSLQTPDFWYRRRVEAQKVDAIGNRIFEHEPPVSPELTRLLNEAKSADESWRELDGCNVAEDGSVWCHGTMTAQASTGWLHNLFCIFDSRICNATHELIRRWQSRQKPKLPTVEAPEGWEWFADHGIVGMRKTQPDPHGGFTVFHLNDDKGVIAMARALLAAYDELNGGHNA